MGIDAVCTWGVKTMGTLRMVPLISALLSLMFTLVPGGNGKEHVDYHKVVSL